MIVYECDKDIPIEQSAGVAVEIAHRCGHSIQLSLRGLRTMVHSFDDPEKVAARWKAMYEPKDAVPVITEEDLAALRYERDAAVQAYEAISVTESSIRAKNLRLTRENGEQRNIIGTHEDTIRTQTKLITSLRESIAELRKQNAQYCDESNKLREAHDRVNKANVGLLNQSIDYDAATRELLANAYRMGGMATVVESDLDELQSVHRKNQAVRIHPESTEADRA
jgi:FtsZ-binding cell division protein ZapB